MLEIFMERTIAFMLFWGIWMLAPLVVDVSMALVFLIMVLVYPEKKERDSLPDLQFLPLVSIIIPVHDSQDTLYACLKSMVNQTYPLEKLQIICVNNGSKDDSFDIFNQFQNDHLDASVAWINMDSAGKSIALNAGIYMIKGDYVMNIDSDAWLDKDAVMRMMEAFEHDSALVAATGAIHIDKQLGEQTGIMDIVHYCEEIEYLVAFNVGRRYQSLTNNLFTLAGAFSVVRRDVILKSFQYSERTVSEDTDLTFHIRNVASKNKSRLGCVSSAIAYVEPISSINKLYSQRVRWQRGQIEVSALYDNDKIGFINNMRSFNGRTLMIDHTLAFSRLTWTFLIPFLYFLGYPLPLVLVAFFGMYVCYLGLDCLYYIVAVKEATGTYKTEIKKIWWVIFFLPIFRFFTYWFRVAGILLALTEQSSWRVENPVEQTRQALKSSYDALKHSVGR